MATLTMAQTYAYARQAGFSPDTAVIMAAIDMAESGNRTNARGDVNLETSYWGPSEGLAQIRTIKSQTGTGSDRDVTRLDDPLQNMIAAYDISGHGRDFTPWTTYTSGKFRSFLGQARTASKTPLATTPQGGVDATPAAFGLPSPSDIAGSLQKIAITLLAVGAGATLVVLGGYRVAGSPRVPKAAALAAL